MELPREWLALLRAVYRTPVTAREWPDAAGLPLRARPGASRQTSLRIPARKRRRRPLDDPRGLQVPGTVPFSRSGRAERLFSVRQRPGCEAVVLDQEPVDREPHGARLGDPAADRAAGAPRADQLRRAARAHGADRLLAGRHGGAGS